MRLNVPTKGRFSLEMDAYADASGVVPAIYFFEDDGAVKDDASARTALRNNEPVGYHDFSGTEDSEYKAVADVNIASPGDYILIVFPDDTSAAKNANTISGKYQYMNLQGIRLTPLAGEYEYLTSFKAVDVLGKMYVLNRGETFNNPLTGESKTVDFNTDPVLRNLGGSNRLLANFGLMSSMLPLCLMK